jgi:hypothetical protein
VHNNWQFLFIGVAIKKADSDFPTGFLLLQGIYSTTLKEHHTQNIRLSITLKYNPNKKSLPDIQRSFPKRQAS